MPRKLSLLMLAGLTACALPPPAYSPPRQDQPHATLKIRHIVHERKGPSYRYAVRIGAFAVDSRVVGETAEGQTIHLLVHPKTDRFFVAGTSFHMEMRAVNKSRQKSETYSCSQYRCSGYGASRRCGSESSTCTRSVTEHYTAMENTEIKDDACSRALSFTPKAGATYVLQFDYLGENECKMQRMEQLAAKDDGEFELVPCGPG